jgi:hypothetical protein
MKRLSMRLAALTALLLGICAAQGVVAAVASAHTCGSNWCSGADSNTSTNIQGNGPQIYTGEVGVYYCDLSGSYCSAFNSTGANNAYTRWQDGTGMGVWYYYFDGGASSSYEPEYPSPYCFGWAQGYDAVTDAHGHFSQYYPSAWVMSMDIESPTSYGWYDSTQAQNRQVFNGFTDYVADKSSADSRCTYRDSSGYEFQYGVYSDNDDWTYAMGSYGTSIPGTIKWTYQYYCDTTWPGSFSDAEWFADTSQRDEWQFLHNCVSPDYDVLYEPVYLPLYGISIGS